MNQPAPLAYSDAKIRSILQRVKTIALVGASSNWNRPSYFVMKYLQSKGYRVIPVNPGTAGQTLLDEVVYAKLSDIPDQVDMVDVFRRSEDVLPIARQAIAMGARCLWQQIGVANEEADQLVRQAGMDSVMNRCVKIEHGRLFGGLNLVGVSTGIISAKRRLTKA